MTLSSPALGLCLNAAGPDAIRVVPYSGSPLPSAPPCIEERSGSSYPSSEIAGFSRSTDGWPRAGRCQWTSRPGTVFLPGRRCWLCFAWYLGCREGDVGAFWLIILLGQAVDAADSFEALSSGGGYMSIAAGFVLLDTAVGVVMGRCLVM